MSNAPLPVPAFRLHHVGTSVPDLDAAVTWYCDTLGFARDCRIELFEVAESTPLPAAQGELAAGSGSRASSTSP